MRELEIRALEDAWRWQEDERKATDRRLRWERAMARYRDQYRQAALAAELAAQLDRFRLAADIDRYLAALRSAPRPAGHEQAAVSGEWIDWVAAYREGIDPARQTPAMPEIPDPSPQDLRPFLDGWSRYGPDQR